MLCGWHGSADMQTPECESHGQIRETERPCAEEALRLLQALPGNPALVPAGDPAWGPLHAGSNILYLLPAYLNSRHSHRSRGVRQLAQGDTVGIRIMCTDPGAHVLSFYFDRIGCVQSLLPRGLSSETPSPFYQAPFARARGRGRQGWMLLPPGGRAAPCRRSRGPPAPRSPGGSAEPPPPLRVPGRTQGLCGGERTGSAAERPQSSNPPRPPGDCRSRRGSGVLLENLENGLRAPRPAASSPDCSAGDLGFAPSSQGENKVWVQSPQRSWVSVAGAAHQRRRAPCRLRAVIFGRRLI